MKEIQLTQRQVALVDDEDYDNVSRYTWYAAWHPKSRSYYAACNMLINGKYRTVLLHRFVMNAQLKQLIDHENHETLDCQKTNLRRCTRSESQANRRKPTGEKGITSNSKGVYFDKRIEKWVAQIGHNKLVKRLGSFSTEQEAAIAYNLVASKLFGDFALLNDIGEQE